MGWFLLLCTICRGGVGGQLLRRWPVTVAVAEAAVRQETDRVFSRSANRSLTAVLVGATKERSLQPSCSVLCGPGVVGWARQDDELGAVFLPLISDQNRLYFQWYPYHLDFEQI